MNLTALLIGAVIGILLAPFVVVWLLKIIEEETKKDQHL